MGGAGMMGGAGIMGRMPAMGGSSPEAEAEDLDGIPSIVVAVIEVNPTTTASYLSKFKGRPNARPFPIPPSPVYFRHKWGKTPMISKCIDYDAIILEAGGKPIPSVKVQFKTKEEALFKGKEKPSTEEVLTLARWTLEHGLVDQFVQVMDKLAATDKSNTAVAAYSKVKADLEKPLAKEDLAKIWKDKLLDGYKITRDDKYHYALIHNQPTDAEVKPQLERLEKTFKAFYYWWAMRGIALKVPTTRVVSVLTEKADHFQKLRRHLTAGPVLADSFFARREGLAVFGGQRDDSAYNSLTIKSRDYWASGFSREKVITGNPREGIPRSLASNQNAIFTARNYALLLKALENEWEETATSHEASRQLVYTSGLLPAKVVAPEWLLFGMGSFFEKPFQAPWATIGGANPYWLPRFRELNAKKKLGATARDTLVQVVTDGYFRSKPAKGEKADAALRKARAASWALTFFLAQKNLPGLQRYFQELARMPRDLELSEQVLLTCFARAFGCMTADRKIDEGRLTALADTWMGYISNQTMDAEGVHARIREYYKQVSRPSVAPAPAAGAVRPMGP